MKNVEKIKPCGIFTNYIFKSIPLAFDESMSYYETLCGVLSLLKTQETVINNNADLLAELESYVKNYFDNLDVQNEINNKLDEMAESGQLTDIIAQYLQLAGVLGYNTVNDMINASNLVNGSFARTYGLNTYNDGKGAFYKIRTITSSDVVDGINIIAVNFSETLIAEKMPDYYINEINNNIENINNELNLINSERTIIIGDSYALDRRPSINITGWAIPLQELLGLSNNDCYIIQDNGGGFTLQGSNGTFLEALTNLSVTNKDTIKNIILCGGLNDISATNQETIESAISSFMSYVKTNYINANVYIGMIGWSCDMTENKQYDRYRVVNKVLPAYQNCSKYDAIYLNGVENVLHDISEYYDNAHPNQTGCDRLANYIYQAFKNGYASVTYEDHYLTFESENITTSYYSVTEKIVNNQTIIFDNNEYGSQIAFTSNAPTLANYNLLIGDLDTKYLTNVYTYQEILQCPCVLKDNNNNYYQGYCSMYIKEYWQAWLRFTGDSNANGKTIVEINLLTPYSCKPTIMQ